MKGLNSLNPTMVYLCCHPLWSVLSSTIVCLCCHLLWSICAVIHYGLFVLSSTMVFLCCRPLWSVCAVIRYGLFVLSSTMVYSCGHQTEHYGLAEMACEALKVRVRVDSPATPGRRQRCGCGRCPLCPRPAPGSAGPWRWHWCLQNHSLQ